MLNLADDKKRRPENGASKDEKNEIPISLDEAYHRPDGRCFGRVVRWWDITASSPRSR
jgi:hypothetical protein